MKSVHSTPAIAPTGAPAMAPAVASPIAQAVAALGTRPLNEAALRQHIDPLFTRVLARPGIYLANHSLGRPPDQTALDLAEGVGLWYSGLGDAWGPWLEKQNQVRAMVAGLAGVTRSDCILPKTSAGQGLRAVLNLHDEKIRVLSTHGEFDSIDVILRHYRERRRIELRLIEPDARGWFQPEAILAALDAPTDLLVISQVMFMTGQVVGELPAIIDKARRQGARVLLDTYHAFGVLPVDLAGLKVDYAVGGGYKYLRGGPGSCWLYVRPDIVDAGRTPLDTGWFAKENPFTYQRPDPPQFAAGGDGFLESTPPVLIPYQAVAGLELTAALGVPRIRVYGLASSQRLINALSEHGVESEGGREDMGAFVVIRRARAASIAEALGDCGIKVDARAQYLRLTPDILTRPAEVAEAAAAVAKALRPEA